MLADISGPVAFGPLPPIDVFVGSLAGLVVDGGVALWGGSVALFVDPGGLVIDDGGDEVFGGIEVDALLEAVPAPSSVVEGVSSLFAEQAEIASALPRRM